SAHAPYATRAPKPARNGRRNASTSTIARLVASVDSSSACSNSIALISIAPIVDILEQLAQFRDVGLVELAVLAEVRDQRRDPPIEQPRQQAFALAQQPGLALEHRRVEVTPALATGGDR